MKCCRSRRKGSPGRLVSSMKRAELPSIGLMRWKTRDVSLVSQDKERVGRNDDGYD